MAAIEPEKPYGYAESLGLRGLTDSSFKSLNLNRVVLVAFEGICGRTWRFFGRQ